VVPRRRIIGTTEDGHEHTRCAISYLKGDFVSVGKHGRGESGQAVATASPYAQKGAWLKEPGGFMRAVLLCLASGITRKRRRALAVVEIPASTAQRPGGGMACLPVGARGTPEGGTA
jgi:hypothetical protein